MRTPSHLLVTGDDYRSAIFCEAPNPMLVVALIAVARMPTCRNHFLNGRNLALARQDLKDLDDALRDMFVKG